MIYVDIKQAYTPVKTMFEKALRIFNIESLKTSIKENEAKLQQSDVWSNPEVSSKLAQEIKEDKDNLEKISHWKELISDIETLFELYEEIHTDVCLPEVNGAWHGGNIYLGKGISLPCYPKIQ